MIQAVRGLGAANAIMEQHIAHGESAAVPSSPETRRPSLRDRAILDLIATVNIARGILKRHVTPA